MSGSRPAPRPPKCCAKKIRVAATDTIAKYQWLHHNPDHDGDPARHWFDSIGPHTLLIVDEAGKAGTLELDTVIGHAVARGASVRLIGDDQQLASISAGGVLRDIRREHGARSLVEVVRFQDRSEAQATRHLRDGDPAALAFLIDNGRVHVGADATAADLAYASWRAGRAAGHDALLLAPTNDLVATLNDRARYDRLTDAAAHDAPAGPVAEVTLADTLRASAGDIICTRSNARWLRISATDYVRNGYRWQVENVTDTGGLRVRHLDSGRRATLPATYVAAHVTLGYATTIDSVQGVTVGNRKRGIAGTCHLVGGDHLTRQQFYVAMTRGADENHVYLSTAETDPHRVLAPKATHPDTAVDVLARVLARNAEQVSASTAEHLAEDPFTRLQHVAAAYTHAVGEAAVAELGPDAMTRIDSGAEAALAGLTASAAWPVLRQHLATLAIAGDDPLARLAAAIGDRELASAADPAAVLDWRLDHTGTHSAGTGPLRWQPAIPPALAALPKWEFLRRRHDRVAELADKIRRTATAWTHTDAPAWARPLLGVNRGLLAEIAVFRAATGVPEEDTRIAGPEQYPVRTRAVQALLEQQAAAAIGRRDADTSRWNTVLDDINPHIRRDSYYPQLAAHLATVARTGVEVNPPQSITRVSHSAKIREARFMVARLTSASFQRLSLISLPSVRCGRPASSRSIASRRRWAARGDTPSSCWASPARSGTVVTCAPWRGRTCGGWCQRRSTRAAALLCGRSGGPGVAMRVSRVRRSEVQIGRCSGAMTLLAHRSGRHRSWSGPLWPSGTTAFSRQAAPTGLFSSMTQWLRTPNRMERRALRSRVCSTVASPPLAWAVC